MRALLLLCVVACDDRPKVAPDAAPSVTAAPAPPPKRQEGCLRSGSLEGIELDAACVLTSAKDDVMHDVMKRVGIEVVVEPKDVIAGSMAVLRVTFTNNADAETLLVFDAMPRAPGPRPDWSRLAGVPDVKGDHVETPRVMLSVTTTDQWDRNVDAVPVVASATPLPPTPRLLGVRLRPGAKITATESWWAVRIPAPAPIFKDDAGHRWVPKTTAYPLMPGDYNIAVEVPFHGLVPAERTVAAHVKVEKAPKRDQ